MADELRGAGLRLSAVRDAAAGGAGEAMAAQSMADCCDAWSGSLGTLAGAVEGHARNLNAAGAAYSGTDAGAMPSAGGG